MATYKINYTVNLISGTIIKSVHTVTGQHTAHGAKVKAQWFLKNIYPSQIGIEINKVTRVFSFKRDVLGSSLFKRGLLIVGVALLLYCCLSCTSSDTQLPAVYKYGTHLKT